MGSGGRTQTQRPSAQDIANTEWSVYRSNLDITEGTPLRAEQVREAFSEGRRQAEENFFRSRANADVMQEAHKMGKSTRGLAMASGKGIKNMRSDLIENSDLIADAAAKSKTRATADSVNRTDLSRLNANRAGEALASVTQQSLQAQARSSTQGNISKMQAKQAEDHAKAQMYGDIAMAGLMKYDDYRTEKNRLLEAEETAWMNEGLNQTQKPILPTDTTIPQFGLDRRGYS
jgi:hypothetical protein